MNLFDKIELFEKMATDLSDAEMPELPAEEPAQNISTAKVRRESLKARVDLLKYFTQG